MATPEEPWQWQVPTKFKVIHLTGPAMWTVAVREVIARNQSVGWRVLAVEPNQRLVGRDPLLRQYPPFREFVLFTPSCGFPVQVQSPEEEKTRPKYASLSPCTPIKAGNVASDGCMMLQQTRKKNKTRVRHAPLKPSNHSHSGVGRLY